MIAYLEGTILFRESDSLVLQTALGVGYQIFMPQSLMATTKNSNSLSCHIHTHVREGEITLYGFASLEEKKLFEMLIKTSGVGPKLGIVILSTLRPPQLVEAIRQQNIAQLNAVPGIGKKTASKLCLDMADQLQKHPLVGLDWPEAPKIPEKSKTSATEDLQSALTNMGFSEKDVLSVLGHMQTETLSFEEQIKKALAHLTSFQ